jgi:hypothetical protein
MAYGTVKVDNITFDDGGSDQNVTVSGLYNSLTSGITVTGTISGAVVIGSTSVSGTTVAGVTVTGTTVQGASGTFTSLTGTTIQGTTATYTTGSFTSLTGTTIQGTTATYTTGSFTSLTGTTTTGTTANFASGVFTTSVSGTTVIASTGTFTSLTGTTTQGTTATYTTGSFTSLTGTTTTGTTSSFTSGVFTTLSGATATFTSGIIASGTAAAPSLAILGDPDTGVFSPGANQLAVATNGVGRLFVDASGNVGVGTSSTIDLLTIGGVASPRVGIQSSTAGGDGGIEFGDPGDDNVGFIVYDHSVDALRFGVNASERLRITSAGLVGIGTTSPAQALQVAGNIQIQANGYVNAGSSGGEISLFAGGTLVGSNRGGQIDLVGGNASSDAGAIRFRTGTGTGGTAQSERARIDSSGRLGIGTTSPGTNFHLNNNPSWAIPTGGIPTNTQAWISSAIYAGLGIQGSSAGATYLLFADENDGDAGYISYAHSADSMIFGVNAAERARIDSSGRLLVGTSSGRSVQGDHTPQIQLEGTGYASSTISVIANSNDTAGSYIFLGKSRGTTVGSNTIVQNNDSLGQIRFLGSDGSGDFSHAANIEAFVDNTPGSGDMPCRLVFSTTADGASSPTERMRIDSSGRMLVGTNTPILGVTNPLQVSATANAAFFSCSTSAADVIGILNVATTGDNIFVSFGTEAGFTSRGTIDYNRAAGQVRYNVTSDRRLKSNIEPAASALDNLSALQVRAYKWAETDYQVNYGFVAQELNEVVPDAVKVGDDGEEVTDAWSVDTGKLVPLLTKALQEAIGEIESLKARLTAAGI